MSTFDERVNILYGDDSADKSGSAALTNAVPANSTGDRASRLYDDNKLQEKSNTEQPNTLEKSLYPETPEVKNNFSLGDTRENRLYADENRVNVDEIDFTLSAQLQGGESEDVAATVQFIAAEAGASQQDVATLSEIADRYAVAPVTEPAARQQAYDDGMTQLHKEFGPSFGAKLEAARDLVASFGGIDDKGSLAHFLETTGLGSDVSFVRKIIQISQGDRAQSRLKQLIKMHGSK